MNIQEMQVEPTSQKLKDKTAPSAKGCLALRHAMCQPGHVGAQGTAGNRIRQGGCGGRPQAPAVQGGAPG